MKTLKIIGRIVIVSLVLFAGKIAYSADGREARGHLTQVGDYLYGETRRGGLYGGGTIYKIKTDGTDYQVLYNFPAVSGFNVMSSARLEYYDNKLYGTTYNGGTADKGTIFSLNLDGSAYSTIRSFQGGTGDGSLPWGGLLSLVVLCMERPSTEGYIT